MEANAIPHTRPSQKERTGKVARSITELGPSRGLAAWDEAGSQKEQSTAANPMVEEEEFGKPTV